MLVGGEPVGPNEGAVVQDTGDTKGELVLVATPLGNLGDISRRALEVLERADAVYCEDTRHSRTIFSAFNIALRGRLHALHEHNEASLCDEVVARVGAGETVAVISDAGTPAISDPGARVVAAVAAAGLRVSTVPGPSAVIAALTISGLDTERFVMDGFIPRKAGERSTLFDQWAGETRTIVAYESPQRLRVTLDELARRFNPRRVAVARELTKLHEEVVRGTLDEVRDHFSRHDVLGEVVVVLEGAARAGEVDDETVRRALEQQLASGASVRDAVAFVVDTFDLPHRGTYELALRLRSGEGP